ncbi:MAG: GNAT family N-acetyltransferase [Acidobacteriota bacterium]|nr:GNAT family N-acetyltransferase [Acidobacteriota bacterium]
MSSRSSTRSRTAESTGSGAPLRWSLDLHQGWSAIDDLQDEWNWLLGAQRWPLPGSGPAGARILGQVRPSGPVPLIAALRLNSRIEGIIALETYRWMGGLVARFLGQGLFYRHQPLLSVEGRRVGAADLLRALSRRLGKAVVFHLEGIGPSGPAIEWLREGLRGVPGWTEFRVARRETELDLRGGWERVLSSIPQTLRRAAAAPGGGSWRFHIESPARVGRLAELRERMDSTLPETSDRWRVMAGIFDAAPEEARRLAVLACDGRPVAACALWVMRRRAIEIAVMKDPALPAARLVAALRLGVIESLARQGETESMLLVPAAPGAGCGVGLLVRHQRALIGAPYPGLARIGARILAWAATREGGTSWLPAGLRGPAGTIGSLGGAEQGRLLPPSERGQGREHNHPHRDRHQAGAGR